MKKIILLMLILFISVAQTCQHNMKEVDSRTLISYDDTLTRERLDSLIIHDSLSFDIENDWLQSPILSEDRNEIIYKYVFIKELTDSTGLIYVVYAYEDTLYIINKRVIK